MGNKITVILEFSYDENENIEDWTLDDCEIKEIKGLEDAIEVARAEIRTHSSNDFTFKAFYEDSPDTSIYG